MRTIDLKRIAGQYEIFKPAKLLFTRLDETETFGPLLSLSVRSGKPLSFITRGQRIPEDLQAAAKDLVLDMVLKPELFSERNFGTAAA
jgi:flagellar biosynthesis protein FlhF